MRSSSFLRCAVIAAALAAPCSTGYGLTIVLNNLGGVEPGTAAEGGVYGRGRPMGGAV